MSSIVRPNGTIFPVFLLMIGMLSAQDIEKDILDIRSDYNEIRQKLDSLETKYIDELRWSAEGGEATAYHKNDQVFMIRAKWFGELGKGVNEYYFSEGKLIFAFCTDFRYNRPFYYNEEAAAENDDEPFDSSKTRILESRLYFKNRMLIRWLRERKEQVFYPTKEERQKETLDLIDELLERFKKVD